MKKHFTYDMFTTHIPLWKKHLARFIDRPKTAGLEIGSFEGRSACWLMDNVLTGKGSTLTCVDVWFRAVLGVENYEQRFDLNTSEYGARIIKRKTTSLTFLCGELANTPEPLFDLIYVDGSHRGQDVLVDAALCWRLLVPGGIMICDDYLWTKQGVPVPPRPAIDAFLVCHTDCRVLHKDYQVIVEKMLP